MPYQTIKEKIETQIVEKKSKFIATLLPVSNKKEQEEALQKIKKQYHDARHHCFAYRILEDNVTERASDDGEPSGTAGAPMLELLRGNHLVNVTAVVTRYFGGVLLGTGGLVKAYSEATASAIEKAELVELKKVAELRVVIEYGELEKLKYYLEQIKGKIETIHYLDRIILEICIPDTALENFTQKYGNIPFHMIKCEVIKEKFAELSIK